jgi:protein-disulfide isomerase
MGYLSGIAVEICLRLKLIYKSAGGQMQTYFSLIHCKFQLAVLVAIIILLPRINVAQENAVGVSKAVASIQGVAITADDLNKAAAADLESIDLQRKQFEVQYAQAKQQVLETNLRRMIQDKLFSIEAAKRGITKDQLIKLEITDKLKEPTQQEIDNFYETNKARIGSAKEGVVDQIKNNLSQQNRVRATETFVESLKKTYQVVSNLQPLRFRIEADGHPAKGPGNAPVTIVEFSDFQCAYCQVMAETLKRIVNDFGNSVRVVYRQYPNQKIHPFAEKAAEASLCANEQGKFWEMHDLMFQDSDNLKVEDLKAKAVKLGLAKEAFDSCLDSNRHETRVKKDYVEAMQSGITGTPSIVINGRIFSGAWPYEEIVPIIKEELASTKKP